MTIKRQGDILFTKVHKASEDKREVKNKVVAYGEVTGHSHTLMDGILFLDEKGEMFAFSEGGAYVVHQEHNRINLEEGIWKVTRQKEYEPSGWRQVAD